MYSKSSDCHGYFEFTLELERIYSILNYHFSNIDTNSTSVPSYCTVDRRIKPRARRPPTSSDESSDGPPRPLRHRVYKVNSFQQRPGQQIELYDDQPRGRTMATNRFVSVNIKN